MSGGGIRLEGVSKTYPGGQVAVRPVTLETADGELVVLVGPSGCGKTTTLRMVAGLETPSAGRIWIRGRDVTRLPPERRDIAMVFQSYALYPHKTVRENLAFPLRMRSTPEAVVRRRISETAEVLGLSELLERKPGELSGGQRQRVAVGRAIVREPQAFLLDEPLSNLDARLRTETRAELGRLQRRLGATMLYVTHDQEEALTLGDRVAVMAEGAVQQVAPPMELYRRPANRFVAGFIGSPAMNFFAASILPGAPAGRPDLTLGVRPHDIRLVSPEQADARGVVDVAEPLGYETLLHVALDSGTTARVMARGSGVPRENDRVGLQFDRTALHWFGPDGGAVGR